MQETVKVFFEMERADVDRLREEARKMGLNTSSLMRVLVKQFLTRLDKGGSIFNSI